MSNPPQTSKHPFHSELSSDPFFSSINKDTIAIRKRWHHCQLCENILSNDICPKHGKSDKRIRVQSRISRNGLISYQNRNNTEVPRAEQRNQQNNVSEFKFDGIMEGFNVETKPVNWKLQKLEKDFLLSYLENALLRYNKQSCKNNWLPSKNRDYNLKEPTTTKNCKELLSTRSFMVRSLLSPFPNKTQVKHKFSQTEDLLVKPSVTLGNENQELFLKLENILKTVLESQDTKQLLELNLEDVQNLHLFLTQMNTDKGSNGFAEEDKNKGKLSLTNKTNQLVPNLETIETLSKEDSFKIKTVVSVESSTQTDEGLIPQGQNISPGDEAPSNLNEYEIGAAASQKLEEIKNLELRISERYGEQIPGLNEPEIEAITESHIEYKSHVQEETVSIRHSEEVDDKVDTLVEEMENVQEILVKHIEINNEEIAGETLNDEEIVDVIENDQLEDEAGKTLDDEIENIIENDQLEVEAEDPLKDVTEIVENDQLENDAEKPLDDNIENVIENDKLEDETGKPLDDEIEQVVENDQLENDAEKPLDDKIENAIENDKLEDETGKPLDDETEQVVGNEKVENEQEISIVEGDPSQRFSEFTDKRPMDDNKVAHFDMNSTEETSKALSERKVKEENFQNIKNLTLNFLNDDSGKLLKVMTNKSELFEILIIINEIIQLNKLKIPSTEEMTSVFIRNLATVQAEARLSRMTNEMDPGDEILRLYAEMNDFIDEALNNDEQMQLIVDNAQQFLENKIEYVSPNIREIVENPESFIKIITLIHHQYHHIDNNALELFFKCLPTFKAGSDSLTESAFKSEKSQGGVFLSDVDLMANFLLILLLMNRGYNYINSKTPIIDIDSMQIDIENLKDWMLTNQFAEADLEPEVIENYKRSDIFLTYKEYIQMVKQSPESNLNELFMEPESLFVVLSKINITQDIVEKMREILQDKKLSLNFNDSPNRNLTVEEEVIVNEILNDEELTRQILCIVDYWVTENGQDLEVSFSDKQINEEFLGNYKADDIEIGVYIQMISNLIFWLKSFINDADPDDTTEEIVLENFYSTNFYMLRDSMKPDSKLNPIFQNLEFLLHLLLKLKNSLKMRLSNMTENVSFDVSQQGVPKSDKMKSEKTEPISSSPIISVAFGKNQRFSNSQADNKERFSDNNLESTYVNVSSLVVVKNNQEISIDDQVDEKIWDTDMTGPVKEIAVVLSRGSESILKNELNPDEIINHYPKKASFSVDEIFKRPSDTDPVHPFVKISPPPTASNSPPLSQCESVSDESKVCESHSIVFERCDDSEKELYERNYVAETELNENVVYVEKAKSYESNKLDETITSVNIQMEEIKDAELEVKAELVIEKPKSRSQQSAALEDELNMPPKSDINNILDTDTDECINEPEMNFESEKLSNSIDDIQQEVLQEAEENLEENLSDEDISVIVEIEQETELVDFSTPMNLQNPPESYPSGSAVRLNNEDEDLITTLGFMIYYLLAIISSKQIL